jgi:hypothetical protein
VTLWLKTIFGGISLKSIQLWLALNKNFVHNQWNDLYCLDYFEKSITISWISKTRSSFRFTELATRKNEENVWIDQFKVN